jgi:hypothetical protein
MHLLSDRYGVDHGGNVYSLRNHGGAKRLAPKKMKPYKHPTGYLTVTLLSGTGKETTKAPKLIHRLVADAFIPNPKGLPEVNHKDGNKHNNHVDNLEWVTKSENALHAFAEGLRTPNKGGTGRFNELHPNSRPVNKLTMNGTFICRYPSLKEAQRQGYSQGNISSVANGKRKSHKGFRWEFA